MNDTTFIGPDPVRDEARRSPIGRALTVPLAAAMFNAALWLVGAAASVSFEVTLILGNIVHRVTAFEIVLATALPVAAGAGVVAWAAGRSRSAGLVLVTAGAALAVASAFFALSLANHPSTGIFLATMHLVAGAAFLVAVWPVVRRR